MLMKYKENIICDSLKCDSLYNRRFLSAVNDHQGHRTMENRKECIFKVCELQMELIFLFLVLLENVMVLAVRPPCT
jgi:hypothetical protein